MTAARIATLTAAITAFTSVINNPRGQIVNRSTLLKEVDTDTADLLEQVADMDDLVLQFDGTDAGKRFIEAWKRARIIVDTGGGHSNGGTPPTPPTPPATPGKKNQFPQKQNGLRKRRPLFLCSEVPMEFHGFEFNGVFTPFISPRPEATISATSHCEN